MISDTMWHVTQQPHDISLCVTHQLQADRQLTQPQVSPAHAVTARTRLVTRSLLTWAGVSHGWLLTTAPGWGHTLVTVAPVPGPPLSSDHRGPESRSDNKPEHFPAKNIGHTEWPHSDPGDTWHWHVSSVSIVHDDQASWPGKVQALLTHPQLKLVTRLSINVCCLFGCRQKQKV